MIKYSFIAVSIFAAQILSSCDTSEDKAIAATLACDLPVHIETAEELSFDFSGSLPEGPNSIPDKAKSVKTKPAKNKSVKSGEDLDIQIKNNYKKILNMDFSNSDRNHAESLQSVIRYSICVAVNKIDCKDHENKYECGRDKVNLLEEKSMYVLNYIKELKDKERECLSEKIKSHGKIEIQKIPAVVRSDVASVDGEKRYAKQEICHNIPSGYTIRVGKINKKSCFFERCRSSMLENVVENENTKVCGIIESWSGNTVGEGPGLGEFELYIEYQKVIDAKLKAEFKKDCMSV